MVATTQWMQRIAQAGHREHEHYAHGEERPLPGYLTIMAVYGGLVGGLSALTGLTGRPLPERIAPTDIVLTAVATHKLSRLIAKDSVTSPLRAPFTAYQGTAGPAELDEEVRGTGGRKAVGELISCPFCLGVWVATGLAAGQVFLPRTTRMAIGTLAALAGADLLQYAHAWLQQQTS
jgi:hypothetical protein